MAASGADDAAAGPDDDVVAEPIVAEDVPAALAGERLDRIVAMLTGASRSDAAALVAAGGARVDGAPSSSGKLRVRVGQRVEVDTRLLPQPSPPAADTAVELRVVHEDEHLVVVDKPPGLVVHPGSGHPTGTLVNGLLARYPEVAGVGDPARPGIVHRLDVGTSGLLVVARTSTAYSVLVDAMSQRRVERIYRAVVWGRPESPTGVIDAPLGRDPRDPLRMAVVVDGRRARTHYRTVRAFAAPVCAAHLECTLETGRTHQIRVHLAAIGHPVVGDRTYGGARAGLDAPRPMLHAAQLRLVHPVTGAPLVISSPLPDDIEALLAGLEPVDGR